MTVRIHFAPSDTGEKGPQNAAHFGRAEQNAARSAIDKLSS